MSHATPDPEQNDPAKTFRIGHKERDDAIEILREAAGDGRITVSELDERMEQVQAAKFPADLDEVLSDLVTELPSDRFRPASAITAARGRAHPVTGWDRFDPLVIRAGWESENRRARWAVPPHIRCEPSMSNIELNFLEVDTDLEVIEVEIVAGMGSVIVVIPEDWGVNVDQLSKTWGNVRSAVNAVPAGRRPLVRVGGSIGMGSFRARFANYFDRRRMAK
ncbi:DUF1707 SHOCT-like domain-containing protein [Brevibacterium renqingii]|jgi:hypothetical protein|uniref:DUF1707 SHOCT-like domain-containing protein n=1 Tax=Brevibacterium renqingii TaxID=2776916 RepID=UPI001ADFE8E8|nr:DUF1707 domain-containing protein [Brevibacterium renqingii]